MTPSDDQGLRDDHDPAAHEDDPTGIRALLSSLPDPGPMPSDLVERIGARLAVEQAHRDQGGADVASLHPDSVLDLAAERTSRRPGRALALLGVAAAGLLVATVTIGELAGVGPAAGPFFDSAAQVPTRSGAADDDAVAGDSAGGAADEEQGEMAGADAGGTEDMATEDMAGGDMAGGDGPVEESAGPLAGLPVGDVVLLAPLGVVTAQDYPDHAVRSLAEQAAPRSGSQGGLSAAGAQACWGSVVPERDWASLGAAQAELGGERVVVLVGTDADSRAGQGVVLPWSCTTGELVEPVHTTTWPAP